MNVHTLYNLKSNPNLIKYLRENSYWYKYLNRNSNFIKNLEEQMKIDYHLIKRKYLKKL